MTLHSESFNLVLPYESSQSSDEGWVSTALRYLCITSLVEPVRFNNIDLISQLIIDNGKHRICDQIIIITQTQSETLSCFIILKLVKKLKRNFTDGVYTVLLQWKLS